MEYSLEYIEVEKAKYMVTHSDGDILSTNNPNHYGTKEWVKDVVSAEIRNDSKVLILDLENGDYVEYEIFQPYHKEMKG